ncbi:TonB-dependent receptor domain-containing protein [Shewanella sedimentimangrovi]|uniref:TonB-dependent receptor n=1 Tax=Shewanella sedimentimangrovi TaxID=2814293 RepID=A0ABX7QZL1_9GAMM|nr:TonB-dependent receptor [Shewanella sedimentimangrovi]QSX36285.1 TonB-dependent receptor [Shewanella sedimentimangrovi]
MKPSSANRFFLLLYCLLPYCLLPSRVIANDSDTLQSIKLDSSVAGQFHYGTLTPLLDLLPGISQVPGNYPESDFRLHHGRAATLSLDGISLLAAPLTAPALEIPLAVEFIDTLALCNGAADCHQGDIQLSSRALSKTGNRFGLELGDRDANNGDIGWYQQGDGVEFMLLGQYARGQDEQQWQYREPQSDSQKGLLMKMAADSLPGARKWQRTELSYQYSYRDAFDSPWGRSFTAKVAPEPFQATAADRVKQQAHRILLDHRLGAAGVRQTHTRLYYQQTERQQRSLTAGEETPVDMLDALALASQVTPYFFDGQQGGIDADLLAYGLRIDGRPAGSEGVHYGLGFQEDRGEYHPRQAGMLWSQGEMNLELPVTGISIADSGRQLAANLGAGFRLASIHLGLDLAYLDSRIERNIGPGAEGLGNGAAALQAGEWVNTDFQDRSWQPSLQLSYGLGNWSLTLASRAEWQAPAAGNSAMRPQESWHHSVSSRWQGENLALEATLWQQSFANWHLDCRVISACNSDLMLQQFNLQDVNARGGHLTLDAQWHSGDWHWPLRVNYDFSHNEAEANACVDNLGLCAGEDGALGWLPEHSLKLTAGVRYANISLTLQGQYLEMADAELDGVTRVDLNLDYRLGNHTFFLRAENLSGETEPQIRGPIGVQTGAGAAVFMGYRWQG